MSALLVTLGVLLLWQLWKRHRLGLIAFVVIAAAVYLAAHTGAAKTGAAVLVVVGLVGFAIWLSTSDRAPRPAKLAGAGAGAGGNCGACGAFVEDIASHEAGHVAVAEKLGYRVRGAVVYPGEGGFTAIPGWTENAWHTMVVAAAGAAGENRNRLFFKAEINGSKSDKWSDAWWCDKLAPEIAGERGITPREAVALAQKEAERLLSANSGRWSAARKVLIRDHKFGDVD